MRSMWKGSVAFGLVNVPVLMYAATEDHDVRFHQVHAADGGRIKVIRTCSVDGATVPYAEIVKAFETSSGEVVVMDDTDFDDLPVAGKREIEVLEFVPSQQIDPVLFERSYYLEPEARALKPYVLLREALRTTERTALVRVVLRQKAQLAALRVRDDVILLQTMLWPDEVRRPNFDILDADADVRPQELTMASSLIDSLSGDFDPDEFHDDYREALLEVIDRKVAGGAGVPVEVAAANEDSGDGIVVDLMAALRASVERNRRTTSGSNKPAPAASEREERDARGRAAAKAAPRAPATRKTVAKTPVKKPPVKKPPVTKTAAKKTAVKRTTKKAAPSNAKPAGRRSA